MRLVFSRGRFQAMATGVVLLVLAGCQPGGRRSEGEPNYLVIQSTDPAQGAQSAYLDQSIIIQFNQDVDSNTVNPGTVNVQGPNGTVKGTYSVNYSQVIFTPDQNFSPNTSYSVTIPGWASNPFCILSLKGDGLQAQHVLSFKTGTQYVPDTDPPSVVAIYVSNGTRNLVSLPIGDTSSITLDISPATSIIVDFDEGMTPGSFTPNTFSLIDQNNPTTPLNGTFRFFNKDSRAVFYPGTANPGGFLDPSGSGTGNYTLLLTSGLQDNSRNPGPNDLFPAPVQVAFRTRANWNDPSSTSPYAENFSDQNMLDINFTNAIWNSAPTAQRLEGGYGAAALAGAGIDGAFSPTQSTILSTSKRPFGYQYTSVNVPQGVLVQVVGSHPAIIRSRGNMTIAGAIVADGMNGTNHPNTFSGFDVPGTPGGQGGPGGFAGGSGNPSNTSNYPWVSGDGQGPSNSAGKGGTWTGLAWSTGWPWPYPTSVSGVYDISSFAGGSATAQDIPGPGGGAGGSYAGTAGQGANVTSLNGAAGGINNDADPTISGFQLSDGGGCGGGGGGGTDDPTPGDQILAFPADDGGAGGGGGGGVINLTCAENCNISGTVSANGGTGGQAPTNNVTPTLGGCGGGGGAGGCIYIQALNLNVSNATLSALGGQGGLGSYNGTTTPVCRGGAGGPGYIRLESQTGTIVGKSSARINPDPNAFPNAYSESSLTITDTQGQSLFFDSRVEDPDYVNHAAGGFNLNVVLNSGTIKVFVQGADADSRGEPDPQTYWPNDATNTNPTWVMIYDSTATSPSPKFTGNIDQIDRYRFIRFRAVFGNLLNVFPPGPYVTDITFTFRD